MDKTIKNKKYYYAYRHSIFSMQIRGKLDNPRFTVSINGDIQKMIFADSNFCLFGKFLSDNALLDDKDHELIAKMFNSYLERRGKQWNLQTKRSSDDMILSEQDIGITDARQKQTETT